MATSGDSDSDSDTILWDTIDKADLPILRNVLKLMCNVSKECRKEVSERLLKKPKTQAAEALKSRHEKCETCRKVFDITQNRKDLCQTHKGYLQILEECFPDDDDFDPNEIIDPETDWRVPEWPEGFLWSCCEKDAKGQPCVVQKHIAYAGPVSIHNTPIVDISSDSE
ncbi:hypothetical protein BJ170DRAFT_684192 [Xylariales sp. AK1849]|nr:hypothetical protein BJ170DRAFT_684192 [Xylariales sp. AK1849]